MGLSPRHDSKETDHETALPPTADTRSASIRRFAVEPVHDVSGDYLAIRSLLSEADILAAAEDIVQRRYARAGLIHSAEDTKRFLRTKLVLRQWEVFAVVFLDQRHCIIRYEELFFGSISGASVHPRIVVQRALQNNAAAVVLAHNHPSGVAEPSDADRQITERLITALALIDVRVLDHIVVGVDTVVSFAEHGFL